MVLMLRCASKSVLEYSHFLMMKILNVSNILVFRLGSALIGASSGEFGKYTELKWRG